jgi:hypothetical protein
MFHVCLRSLHAPLVLAAKLIQGVCDRCSQPSGACNWETLGLSVKCKVNCERVHCLHAFFGWWQSQRRSLTATILD